VVDRELSRYVIKSIALARDEAQVRAELASAGWSEREITETYAEARSLLAPTGMTGSPPLKRQTPGLPLVDVSRITFGRIFLFIGVLIIVCAAAFFVTINWLQWSPVKRFLALLVPMLFCALCGGILLRAREKATATYFLFAAGLLMPFVLFAVSSEVLKFDFIFAYREHSSQFPWGVALLVSTIGYMLCRKSLGHLGWTFLAGVSTILGIGAICSVIFTTSNDEEIVARAFFWGALIASGVVASIALRLEKLGAQAEAKLLYVPPVLGMTIPLLALGLMGAYIRPFLGDTHSWHHDWLVFGGSVLISGIIALALAAGAVSLYRQGYVELSPYRGIFGAFGCILALSGGMIIGTAESEMYREFIWLALIAASIYFGQRMQVRSFLYVGTLFLVIFVFQFGFEYFENEIGWPLVLFGAGLISLALGVIAERLSRGWTSRRKPPAGAG
jgi:hypothetical protein